MDNKKGDTYTLDMFAWSSLNSEYGINPDGEKGNDKWKVFVDWGKAYCDSQGITPETAWRTLSKDEWDYLINGRPASTVCGVPDARYVPLRVVVSEGKNKEGYVLLPDDYAHPHGLPKLNNINGWTAELEEAGAVFIPAWDMYWTSNDKDYWEMYGVDAWTNGRKAPFYQYWDTFYRTYEDLDAQIAAQKEVIAANEAAVNWMDKKIGFGIEGGLQIGPTWRIVLGGSFNYGLNPGHSGRPGTAYPELPAESNWGEIPTYNAVAAQKSLSYLVYTGFRIGGSYASNSKKWDDPLTMGASVAEAFYLKGAIVGGADYFFTENFFLGISLNLFDYTYTVSRYKPQEGLAALSADGHLFGAIANPALRIGLRFGGK